MDIQLILTYLIVAVALVFRGEKGFIVCLNPPSGEEGVIAIVVVVRKRIDIKKAASKSSFFILMLVSALVRYT